MLNKTDLLGQLPVKIPQFTLRAFARKDFDLRAHWPDYPFPYTPFNCRWRTLDAAQRDASFTSMMDEDASLILTADDTQHECIAYLGLREIDWATGSAGNLFLRLHPQWCDRGVGTTLMSGLVQWCFAVGLTRLRHDVCALNPRAIRCFEKAGYCITARFWQADPFLETIPPDDPVRQQARPHVRVTENGLEVRCYWMEVSASGDSDCLQIK